MMTLPHTFLVWSALGACLCLAHANGGNAIAPNAPAYATDRILVRFKPDALETVAALAPRERLPGLVSLLGLPPEAQLMPPPIAGPLDPRRRPAAGGTRANLEFNLAPFLYLRLPPGLNVAECVHRLEHHPLLDYAEPDYIGTVAETIPNDPNFADQWHHQNPFKPSASIQTPLAWDITQGSTNVLVAVLDSGLADLPEFAGRTVPGYNFANTNDVTLDDNGHGTHVAGVLAANANNGLLGAGVDWHCRIMPVKVFDASNLGFHSWWAQGIDYAVAHDCKIINLSGASTEFGRTVQRAITNAIAQGAIFVTAAGNLGDTNISFPGYLTPCITVGATDRDDRRAPFSNSGAQLDLVAPGADIATAGPFGGLEYARGTSFSAPMVAGVCALLASLRPELAQADVRLLLCAGAEDQVGDATDVPGFDNYHGWGRLNVFHSLRLATTRIDSIRYTLGVVSLSWPSPANASDRQPYRVEWKPALAAAWTVLTNQSAFRYDHQRTYWTDDGTQTGGPSSTRFYRIGLRPL